MTATALTMKDVDLQAMVGYCRRELPNEACGILGGREGRVESVHPVRSASPKPARFAMDPVEQFRALDAICRAGRSIVGIYHSHPRGPDTPSGIDLERWLWPGTTEPSYAGAVQVIVSLSARAAPAVKGYLVAAGSFQEVPIIVC